MLFMLPVFLGHLRSFFLVASRWTLHLLPLKTSRAKLPFFSSVKVLDMELGMPRPTLLYPEEGESPQGSSIQQPSSSTCWREAETDTHKEPELQNKTFKLIWIILSFRRCWGRSLGIWSIGRRTNFFIIISLNSNMIKTLKYKKKLTFVEQLRNCTQLKIL